MKIVESLPPPQPNLLGGRFNQQLLTRVESYRNEKVLYRFQTKLSLDVGQAEMLFKDTKRFLYLCSCYRHRGPLSPTAAIDNGWHEFLMFTRDYQEFCEQYFGKFLHHCPFVPWIAEKPGGIYRTYCLAREIFGTELSANWMLAEMCADAVEASNCSCGGSCGGGCNSGSCTSA